MVDLNAHEAGNGGKKPREAYSLPSLPYSERAVIRVTFCRERGLRAVSQAITYSFGLLFHMGTQGFQLWTCF